jgi:polyhydroxybutyrate depolymerase
MNSFLAFLRSCVYGLLGIIAVCGALFGYFIYSPDPELPQLSGTVTKSSIAVGELKRTYRTYLPKDLLKGAPLVVVMHGSGQNGAQIRLETGYGFDRLADQHRFAVVYPDAGSSDWNDCSKIGDFTLNGREVDDVKFVVALADKLITEIGIDRNRVFATGVSSGGFMSIRLALEAPSRFRAVAAVSANVPAPENFKCKPAGQGSSVMFMNGTKDPLVPFAGGESSLFGLFFKGGNVQSSRESGQYFADINKIGGTPTTIPPLLSGNDSAKIGQTVWRNDGNVEVQLVTIQDGGHGLPQPYWRRPRLLGPSPMAPDGAKLIWDFFARQRP